MKIGLYFDLRNPPAWAQNPSRLHGFTLEMCEEAERLGADSVWTTEHHLFDDGYLTQPLVFLSAVAARTRRIRIGTAILLAPLRPAPLIAEEAALVDIISGGRLDLGLGAGYRAPEFELYNTNISTRFATTDERARELRRIWGEGRLKPMPVQHPLPIWMGYQGPKSARRAGLLGERLLSAHGALYEPYRQGLIDAGHDPAVARMAGGIQGWVSEDPEADWREVKRYAAAQIDSYRRHMVEGTDQPTPRPIDMDQLRQRSTRGSALDYFMFGTPDSVARQIRDYTAGGPVETVFIWASIAGMPEPMVARHVQTICTKLRSCLSQSPAGPTV
jgi:alkanesulfonate monooxygenase SsuD/methylene tetrahydromethanopterin reductase-like flavin-dependent oxidoreductase (luciferase family)